MATILGLCISHDSTLSVLRDGQHVFSIAEESLTRIKSYLGFPFQALDYIVKQDIVDPNDVHAIAISIDHFHGGDNRALEFLLARDRLYYDIQNEPRPEEFYLKNPRFSKSDTDKDVRQKVKQAIAEAAQNAGIHITADKVICVNHHLAHAAAGYYSSDFNDPLVITLDGEGDLMSGSVCIENENGLERLAFIHQNDSLGKIYSQLTRQLGYKIARHEGKITGLAAYGDPTKGEPILSACIRWIDGIPYYKRRKSDRILAGLKGLFADHPWPGFAKKTRYFAEKIKHLSAQDQAASVQSFLEKQACFFIAEWIKRTGKKKLILSGGVFANVKLNQRIAALDGVDEMFVFPNMGDGGIAVGAAQIAHTRIFNKAPDRSRLNDVYLGPDFSADMIERILSAHTSVFDISTPDNLIDKVACLIHQGKIIGWFQGRMEYGPRALGNRSILARPTEKELNNILNKRLSRTEFMPFAPSCLFEHAHTCFHIDKDPLTYPAEFMTITFNVKKDWADRVQAVSHVDNTARPQLVRKQTNPKYYALIKAYYELSGIPMIVNTSFNNHEEPIVCHPNQALNALERGIVDYLVMEDHLIGPK